MMPKVYNVKDKNIPPEAIYIGRGSSKWGNPFIIGRDGPRESVIRKYEAYLLNCSSLLRCLPELRGKDLVCYCAPKPCHGDVLLRLANE
jgi:hypothetical protein